MIDLRPLAAQLEVSVESLEAIGAGRNGTAWTFPERNAEGEIIGTALRHDDGRKSFQPGGKRGLTLKWPLPNYSGISRDDPILSVEGPSDTTAAIDLRYAAVGRPSATGGLEHLRPLLKGRHVVVVGENDGEGADDPRRAGKLGAEKIADGLCGHAASVRVVYPPDDVKDLREWIVQYGCDRAELDAAIRGAADHQLQDDLVHAPIVVRLADVEPQPVRWLWPGRVALGKLTLIAGDPGLGKSLLTIDMAARVSAGTSWPDNYGEVNTVGGVVLLSAEDDLADTIRPRLDAAGADPSWVVSLKAVQHRDPKTNAEATLPFSLERDLPALERTIRQTRDCRLVIVDPITAYLGGTDSHKNADIRGLLHPLSDLAAQQGVAVVAVTHLNKNAAGPAMYRSMGSLAFVAAARAVWAVVKDKDAPTRRLMLPVKANLCADPTGLAFAVCDDGAGPVIGWEPDPISVSADDALAIDRTDEQGDALPEAMDWLRHVLADGPVPAQQIKRDARSDGIAARTLDRAKKRLRVTAAREGFGMGSQWLWSLPQ